MLGSDDILLPDCLSACELAFNNTPEAERYRTYYWVGLNYCSHEGVPDGRTQFLPCNAALVTKPLWRLNGGFPPESGVGAPDSVLIGIMTVHPEAGIIKCVDERRPLYNYRMHDETHTRTRPPYFVAIQNMKVAAINEWKRPTWGRM